MVPGNRNSDSTTSCFLMANPLPLHYTSNCALVERSLRAIDTTKEIIRDYTMCHESLAHVDPASEQRRGGSMFQREKIKEILDAARLFQAVMERAVESLAVPPSPFRRLPIEILLEIFSHAVKQEEENRRRQMESWRSAPFVGVPIILARVCSQWRAIVHQSPILWEQILIPVHGVYTTSGGDLVPRRVARWIAQGVQQNQSLFIEGWNDRAMQRLISHAGSHATPWRSIDVAISYASPVKQWDAQSLYATKVKLYRRKGESSLSFFLPLLQKANEWTIMGTLPVWGNSPWTSLVSLKLQSFAARHGEQVEPLPFGALELCELLNAAPYLKKLQLDFTRTPRMAPILNTPPNMVEHQTIESLSLHLHHISDNMGLFGLQTIMPSLHSLRILSLRPAPSVLGDSSETFVGRWDQVNSMSLHGLEIAGLSRLLALFADLPNVDTLDLCGLHVNALVHLLNIQYRQTKSPTPELPLPQLTRVVLRGTDVQGSTLIDMIQTRLADMSGPEMVRMITEVEIHDSPGVALDEWKCIQTLLERGRSLIRVLL